MATLTSYLTPGPFQPGSSSDRRTTYRAPGPLQPQLVTSVTYNVTGSGGLTLGGSATASLAYSVVASGGLALSGSASVSPSYSVTGSGGLTLSGSGTTSSTYTVTTSGGLALSGSASVSPSYSVTGSGGLTLSGSGTTSLSYNIIASGGLSLSGSATVALVVAADLFEAIVAACNADSTLRGTGYFNRSGWLWISEAPEGEPMPYAVLTQPASNLSFSTFTDDGSEPTVESATYQVSLFSTDRELNRTIGDRINASLSSAALTHADGYLMSLRCTSAADLLDPDRGPGGVDVWQRVLLLDVLDGHNQTVITTTYNPTQQPTDLTAALVGLLGTDSTLCGTDYFNRSDWLWFAEAPDGQTLPYAVLTQTRSIRDIETLSSDASRPVIEHAGYECHVFAPSRATCRTLGERIASLIDGANLTFGNGYQMYLRRQSDTDTLDDDRSRLGADVWHRVVTLTAIIGHTE